MNMVPGDATGAWSRLDPIIEGIGTAAISDEQLRRLAAIGSTSRALAAVAAAHPQIVTERIDTGWSVPLQNSAALIEFASGEIDGSTSLATATAGYSRFIDGLVERTLNAARPEVTERHQSVTDLPFTIIAMGKWGAEELNYASDIDLMFVHGDSATDPEGSRAGAIALASRVISRLSASSFEGTGLVVDADLRPEGSMGPLSRRLDAFATYYERWAEPWELQALIKSRPAAGDLDLGAQFSELAADVVWETGIDSDALRGLRRLKAEAESQANASDLKRAPGGIRDVEFTVQLLQLVHGRHDQRLRLRGTLEALAALEDGRYLSAEEAEELRNAYLLLRRLEHLIQVWDLRQTHRLPSDPETMRRLAIGMGLGADAEALSVLVSATRSATRTLHERIYFRPVLESLVRSPSARLGPEKAYQRLSALGFANTRAATDALEAMTRGLSRKSGAMQQMMPLMLDWLSLSPDPDLGLSQLRVLLANTTDHSSLVSRLLNNPATGERLALLLGTGRLFGDLIDRIPEFVPRLADDEAIDDVRNRAAAIDRLQGLLASRPHRDDQIGTIRRFSRRMRLRIAARDVIRNHDTFKTMSSLAEGADTAIVGSLDVATAGLEHDMAVVAMGRWGGGELSYGSDLDLMYVFDRMDRDAALSVPAVMHEILSAPGRHGDGYILDTGLRPEGKNGPNARSLESTARYYEEWAEPWEYLALIRARPVAGAPETMERFQTMTESVLWQRPFGSDQLASIRKIKARVESERVGPDEDADFHLKLGPGSLSDIEFLTQLMQLKYGREFPAARVPGTLAALTSLLEAGLLTPADHLALVDSFEFCNRVRLRLHLQRGRLVDFLPTDPEELSQLSASLGYDRSIEVRETYQRVTRRARRVFMSRFFE